MEEFLSQISRKSANKPSYDGDLWYSKRVNGHFQKPVCLDNTLNTASGEDEPNISPDGKKIVYQSWMDNWKSNGGPYYIADLNGTKCKNVKGLGDGISRFFIHSCLSNNDDYATDGATMSPDGKRFIVSCGKSYKAGLDIYMSEKDKSGTWSVLQPLPFNTIKDERSVFLAADGITLFFASDGYNGLGGLDIYKTTIDEKGNIGEIINLGNKINTKGDDYSFIINAAGTDAYFVRDGDIYEAIFSELVPEIKPGKSIVIKGKITHNYDSKLTFTVKIQDEKTKTEMGSVISDDSTGTYYLFLKNVNPSYKISVFNGSIKMAEEVVQADTLKNYSEITKDFNIKIDKKITENDTNATIIRMREDKYENGMFARINFEYDSYSLSQKYYEQLNSVIEYLSKHKKAKLGIAGYSDIRGTNEYNQKLSQKRAESVNAYFLKNGIDKNRLIINWYGSQSPITLDETIQGGWLNRRVEFVIVNEFPVKN